MIDFETTVSAIILLMVFSVLFKNTIIFRLALALWLGSTVGYTSTAALNNLQFKNIEPLLAGELFWLIPLFFGALIWTRFFPKYAWLARFPTAITIGSGTGAAVAGVAIAQLWKQMISTARISTIDHVVVAVIVITILIYFIMTIRTDQGAGQSIGYLQKIGRFLLFMTFGLGFGSYAIARFSHVIGRIQFIFLTWLEV